MTMHTPTPWKVTGWNDTVVNDSQGNTIIAAPGSSTGTLVETKANAAYIVRCVNSHEALVEALRDLYIFADGLRQEWQDANPTGRYNPFRLKHLAAAKQALAHAEGRSLTMHTPGANKPTGDELGDWWGTLTYEGRIQAHAAPDLYAALKHARRWMDDRRQIAEYVAEIANADDAIAKAEGRAS